MLKWHVITTRRFDEWFADLAESVKVEIAANVIALQRAGPALGRPRVEWLIRAADELYDAHLARLAARRRKGG